MQLIKESNKSAVYVGHMGLKGGGYINVKNVMNNKDKYSGSYYEKEKGTF